MKIKTFFETVQLINKKRKELGMDSQELIERLGILSSHEVLVVQEKCKHTGESIIWLELKNGGSFFTKTGRKRKIIQDFGDFYQLSNLFNYKDWGFTWEDAWEGKTKELPIEHPETPNDIKKLYEFVKNEIGIYELNKLLGTYQLINIHTKEVLIKFENN